MAEEDDFQLRVWAFPLAYTDHECKYSAGRLWVTVSVAVQSGCQQLFSALLGSLVIGWDISGWRNREWPGREGVNASCS